MIHGPSDQLSTTTDTRTAVGRAPAAWSVQVAGVTASRIGEAFHRPLTAANATAPVWQNVVIQRDTATPTTSQHFWYAPQNLAPVHDADGNLTNDGRWVYSWDAENRLVQMESTTQATAAGHPYTRLQFAYDWQGRRIARHVWQGGTQASPTFKSSHRWLYDGWNLITEFTAPSASSTTLTRLNTFTWGLDLSGTLQGAGGVGGLLVQTAVGGGVIERASYDGNGNIVAWTKSNAGAPTSRREYDAFGNTLVSEGAAPSTFGFSTKMQDVETGLYYYGYRYYDPATGRWPSRDPIEEKGGINLYGFVGNRVINFTDILGLSTRLLPPDEIVGLGKGSISVFVDSTASRMDHWIGDGAYGEAKLNVSAACSETGKPLLSGLPTAKTSVRGRAGLFQNKPIVDIDLWSPFHGSPTFEAYYSSVHSEESLFVVSDFKTSTDQSFASFAFPLAASPGLAREGTLGIWIGGFIAGFGIWYDSISGASSADRHIMEFRCSCIEMPDGADTWWIAVKASSHGIFQEKGVWGLEVDFSNTTRSYR